MAKKNIQVFDPVKTEVDGVRARRAIWTTQSIEMAINGLNEGKRLIANPFYENNVKILKADLTFKRTEEEIEEWKRCQKDIIYFVEKYCKLLTPLGIKHVKLRDYQVRYLKHVQANQLSIGLTPRQAGKCVSYLSEIQILIKNQQLAGELKKSPNIVYYKDNIVKLPMFELMNLYRHGIIWRCKYAIYRKLYELQKQTKAMH